MDDDNNTARVLRSVECHPAGGHNEVTGTSHFGNPLAI